jgi:hypothetical protein
MTTCDTGDPNVEGLKRLRSLTPDPMRADRVRLRCRAHLARSRRRQARNDVITGLAWRVLAPAIFGYFCILYLAALVAATLRLRGILD